MVSHPAPGGARCRVSRVCERLLLGFQARVVEPLERGKWKHHLAAHGNRGSCRASALYVQRLAKDEPYLKFYL